MSVRSYFGEEKQVVELDLVEKEENGFVVLQTKNVAEKERQEGQDNGVLSLAATTLWKDYDPYGGIASYPAFA